MNLKYLNARHNLRRFQRQGTIQFDDFCDIIREDQKADLIDGVIYLASPDPTDVSLVEGWFRALLTCYVSHRQLGLVLGPRAVFRIAPTIALEPDIAFLNRQREKLIQNGYVDGQPDFAIEAGSAASARYDYDEKLDLYERVGIREYWLLDEMAQAVLALRAEQGEFRRIRSKKGVIASQTLPGFWIKTDWLWQRPQPDLLACLNEIMESHP